MRDNGVPNFPDLSSDRMLLQASGQTVSVNGVSIDAPAFSAARARCERYMPGHVVASNGQQAQAFARALNFSRCMRAHGVPNFPDPKAATTGPGGNSAVDLRHSGLNFNSPAFMSATKACGGGPKGP